MVNICTKRTIVANDYNELLIRYSTSKKYYIEARPDTKKYISNELEMELMDSLINLDDRSIITGLIDHFFEGVTLNKMLFDHPVQDKVGYFDIFGSDMDSKILALQTSKTSISTELKMQLRHKYFEDRQLFLNRSNINRYSVKASTEGSSYFALGKRIYINLFSEPLFIENEICFLNNFISMKLKECQQEAVIRDAIIKYGEYNAQVCIGKIITCGNFLMKISPEFACCVDYIVEQHNKEVNKSKIKQLKMEGLK